MEYQERRLTPKEDLDRLLDEIRTEERLKKNRKYHDFHKEAQKLRVNEWGEDSGLKRKLLIRYFPGQFGAGGRQDLQARGYDPVQIGNLFLGVYKTAEKRVRGK
ncbi:MAG: hypothetical protein ABH817_02145 [archaeon]